MRGAVSRQFPRWAGKSSRPFHLRSRNRGGSRPIESIAEARATANIVMPNLTKTGRYELLGELGSGAMGVVYRAHDPVIGRDVAVKTLHLSPDGSGVTRPDFVTRFQTEARAAGILTHPNIVVVYDAGEEAGIFYITMELVLGRSLQALLDARQPFPLPRSLRIIEQACAALGYAHQHNIVHRDIKPANLMITEDDTVKITDFGTAKILRFNATQTAQVIGTPSYMSPEQIKGRQVDGRADIFALGVILYELVTGEKPFPGESVTTVIYKIVNEEPVPPRSLAPSIHPGLAALILHALAKDPTERFQTCAELAEALKNYRSFPHEIKEELHPAYLPPPPSAGPPTIRMGLHLPNPRPNILLTEVEIAPPAPSRGHTLYNPQQIRQRRGMSWSAFWLSLFLIGVIAASGTYVWPYTHDVWQVIRTWYEQKRSGNSPSTDKPATGAAITLPSTHTPSRKTLTPPAAPLPRVQEAPRTETAPAQETKADDSAVSGATAVNDSSPLAQKPASVDAPHSSAPNTQAQLPDSQTAGAQLAANSQSPANLSAYKPLMTPHERLETVKGRIDHWLSGTGLSDRVQVTVVGGGLLLQGKLRAGEHQALMKRMQAVPAWVHVTDDIAFGGASLHNPDE
jgi:serine/threonine-protein kinase